MRRCVSLGRGRSSVPAIVPGEPVLFLHGFLSSNLQWEINRSALDDAFHWVAAELWGHGSSPAPGHASAYTADAYIEAFEKT